MKTKIEEAAAQLREVHERLRASRAILGDDPAAPPSSPTPSASEERPTDDLSFERESPDT